MATEKERLQTVEEAPDRTADRLAEPASDLLELSNVIRRLAEYLASQTADATLRHAVMNRDEQRVRQLLAGVATPGDAELDEAGTLHLAIRLGPVDTQITIRLAEGRHMERRQ
jgi:hypothetical protein